MKRDTPSIPYEYEVTTTLLVPTAKQRTAGVKHILRFIFRTVREFSAFRYVLNVEMKNAAVSGDAIVFNIGGISIPSLQLPANGAAGKQYDVELSSDSLQVELHRKDQRQHYVFRVEKKILSVNTTTEEHFARMVGSKSH